MPTGNHYTCSLCLILLLVACGGLTSASAQDSEFGESDQRVGAPADTSVVYLTWSGVTVGTKDGWSFSDATISWVPGGETARLRVLRPDGLYKDWDVFEIVMIRNALGVDITPEIAAAMPDFGNENQVAHWRSQFNEVGRPTRENPSRTSLGDLAFKGLFHVAYGANLSFGRPILGMWYDGVEGGIGFMANVRVATHKRTYVNFLIHHLNLAVEDFYLLDEQTYGAYRVETDYNLSSFFLLVGTYGPRVKTSHGHAYFETGVGFSNHRAKLEIQGESISHSEGKLSFMLRVGYWAPLGQSTRLDLGVSLETKDALLLHRDEYGGAVLSGHVGLMFF